VQRWGWCMHVVFVLTNEKVTIRLRISRWYNFDNSLYALVELATRSITMWLAYLQEKFTGSLITIHHHSYTSGAHVFNATWTVLHTCKAHIHFPYPPRTGRSQVSTSCDTWPWLLSHGGLYDSHVTTPPCEPSSSKPLLEVSVCDSHHTADVHNLNHMADVRDPYHTVDVHDYHHVEDVLW